MGFRIGLGTDLHRLQEGIPLMLGGEHIPFHKGTLGHSDGDVLIHAICDAMLGALALRDIGYHFPDTDARNRGMSSTIFLKEVMKMIEDQGWMPVNLDATIHLELPKLAPHIDKIRQTLSIIMQMDISDISIKAKTGERTGIIGSGEAVEAIVVCLLHKNG